jgi:hydroxyethylthiazole kinase-like uncharacterized protein yjeF
MPHELLTPGEMYRADALAIAAGVKSMDLMERAGAAVADEVAKRWKSGAVAVLCGPGNNGGDGFVAARLLKRRRRPVRVFLMGDRNALKSDASVNARRWDGKIEDLSELASCLASGNRPAVIVDALFGAGLARDFPAELAGQINGAGLPVVAVDVPSGLDGLTGSARGSSVKADVTVTFLRKKPGHVLFPGRELCGEVVLANIGIPETVLDEIRPKLKENAKPQWPELTASTHKYRRGSVLVVSGPQFNTGAARLAARAAQRAGAGVVTIAGDEQACAVHAAHVSSIMLCRTVQPSDLHRAIHQKRANAVCIGPASGVGPETMAKVRVILESPVHAVLDADALTSFAQNPLELFELIQQRRGKQATVMTPHEGEFKRLFSALNGRPESRLELARKAAAQSAAIVVLKGADTIVAMPDGQASINANAPPSLATAGSGDVLAGLITGLLAQGMMGFEAASAGVWLHGNTAAQLPLRGLIAEDLIEKLRFDE